MSSPNRGGEARAPRPTPRKKNVPEPRQAVEPVAPQAPALDSTPEAKPAGKKFTLVAGGSLTTLLTSSVVQAFDLVPAHLHAELNGASAVVATAALSYILRSLIPKRGSFRFTWDIGD
ncbi:hypothetical protein ACIBSW_40505 [Actinoplanes sp. NPDC049668]|uniref:hypothetical protein n=1 Tax=unclassified Actinoplanes TaxID=2626549 RepID=UPI0033B28B00